MAESAAKSIDETLDEAWEAHNAELKDEEAPLEAVETEEVETGEDTPEGDPKKAAEEGKESQDDDEEEDEPEPLKPQQHWPEKFQKGFESMSRDHQELWMEREKLVEQGFQAKAAELGNAKQAISGFQEMIAPLVQDWERQGLAPSQGLMRLVALEKDLRENPASALMRMAGQYGVNLEKELQDQPYVDPQTRQVQEELRRTQERLDAYERQREQEAQRQQQTVRDSAFEQIRNFASTPGENGGLKYPYANDEIVLTRMGHAIEQQPTLTLAEAYEAAMGYLKNHPFYRDQIQQQSAAAQAKVQKAKSASKTVKGKPDAAKTSTNQDAEILKMLEEQGFD